MPFEPGHVWRNNFHAILKGYKEPLLKSKTQAKEILHGTDTDIDKLKLFRRVRKVATWDPDIDGHFLGHVRVAKDAGLFNLPEDLVGPSRFVGGTVFFVILLLNIKGLLMNLVRSPQVMTDDLAGVLAGVLGYNDQTLHAGGKAVAAFELLGLLYYLCSILKCIYGIVTMTGKREKYQENQEDVHKRFCRWHNCFVLFKSHLPKLQSFSALSVLMYVVPGVMVPNFTLLLQTAKHHKWSRGYELMMISLFMLTHVFLFFFGFEAFLVKLSIVMPVLNDTKREWLSLCQVFIFLNQLLGVVNLNVFINQRLFNFIFGGEDNFVGDKERRRMLVFEAGLQMKLWEKCGGNVLKFVATTLTFNDADFQKLVLVDVAEW